MDPAHFLYYLVKHNVNVLKNNTHGSVFDTITRDTFDGIKVNVPEIEIQKKIAGLLSSFDEKIKVNNDINKNFYENDELIAITKELADTLRKNRTVDWQKRDSARAKMRMLIKRLLKKHKYPPEGMEDAVQTVMTQCELWADNNDMEEHDTVYSDRTNRYEDRTYNRSMVAESKNAYGKNSK